MQVSRYMVSHVDYVDSLDPSVAASSGKWEDFNRRIFLISSGVWEAVRNVLCFDAPEGHDIGDDDPNEQDTGTKDALSFCWRALKESRFVEMSLIQDLAIC